MVYYKIDPREDRLPKWAQDHIASLRHSILAMQRALEQDVTNTNTFLKASYPIEDEALPNEARIVFKTASEKRFGRFFEVHIEGEVLKIYCESAPSIKPTSSNCLELKMER
jgi:hypothetical protein